MIETLLELICCKKGGATKKEIVAILAKFGFENLDIAKLFSRIHYARAKSDSFSVIMLNEHNKWFTFDNEEYCRIVLRILHENPKKPILKPTNIPYWAFNEYELFYSIFNSKDFE